MKICGKKFKAGDSKAYEQMYALYAKALFNYGRQICADADLVKDCIQDLYIELWRTKEKLSDTDSIKYYLFKSLRRKIINELKKVKNKTELEHNLEEPAVLVVPYDIEYIAEQLSAQKKEVLNRAVNTLPIRQKEAIFLIFYDNLSYREVASILAINLKSVYTLVWKGLENLKQALSGSLYKIIAILITTIPLF